MRPRKIGSLHGFPWEAEVEIGADQAHFPIDLDQQWPTNSCPLHSPFDRGNYDGDEANRLATLKFAAIMGAPFIDVEFKSSSTFFASELLGHCWFTTMQD